MTGLLAALCGSAWLGGWLATARHLFERWRPARVPLCGVRHYSGGCSGGCHYDSNYRRYVACGRGHHTVGCYRRRKADKTTVSVDSDSSAGGWAMFAGLAWPFVWIFLWMTASPPELPAEKLARLEQLERDAGMRDE